MTLLVETLNVDEKVSCKPDGVCVNYKTGKETVTQSFSECSSTSLAGLYSVQTASAKC